ncbi:MAG: ABC transporter permease [Porticoccaceae bacterium]|nr:ABC transporter permease [Porticoccaceae bacterium]
MNNSIANIDLLNLAIAFIPVVGVIVILYRWSLKAGNVVYAFVRMLGQLLLVGYVLTFLFSTEHGLLVLGVLVVMILAASWIALGSIKAQRTAIYSRALMSIAVGGGSVLILVTQGVLELEPWYQPRLMIPLAGMIFAGAMNGVSLAAERLHAELGRGVDYVEARNLACQAALIPVINSLFAVGLVSLPGMMTGQILSGVSPLVAARYQVMVMCMLFGATGFSVTLFLIQVRSLVDLGGSYEVSVAGKADGGNASGNTSEKAITEQSGG